MIKVDERNSLVVNRVKIKLICQPAGRNCLTSPNRNFCFNKIFSYTSNFLLKSAMCLSKTSLSGVRPCLLIKKQTNILLADVDAKRWVLTVCRVLLLQLRLRASQNGRLLQTQLAGSAHCLGSQSEVTVSLGQHTLTLYNSLWLCFRRGRSRHRPNQDPEQGKN